MNDYQRAIQKWMRQFGAWAPIVFVGFYIAAMLVMLPGTRVTGLAAVPTKLTPSPKVI